MRSIVESLDSHIARYLEHLGVDQMALEMEGLGLRPLEATKALPSVSMRDLSRRFYRMAQWTEVLQGEFWLTDPESEVYRYYSLTYKLDDCW